MKNILHRIHRIACLTAVTASLSAAPLIVEDYEGLEPGSPEPNFPGINGNHPDAVFEVAAEVPGEELFYPGNTRYFRWESLAGQNPDPAGSPTQFNGGPTDFVPFASPSADVVSVGFDFIVGPRHGELLFGIGEPQQDRNDDQNYAVQLRIRGPLGLTNRPEVVASGADTDIRVDIQRGVPYRVELVANKTGAPLTYESPLGTMTVGNERYDVYLFNHRTGILQLIIQDAKWKLLDNPELGTQSKDMQGIWWGTFRYDGTGRALDIKLNDIAVYENQIHMTGYEVVPPGPLTAHVDFDDDTPAVDTNEPLWNLPGNLVADTDGLYGADNVNYFHVNRRNIPNDGISNKFRFNGVVDLVSMGFDFTFHRDEVITGFGDAHDESFIAFTGGDTRANIALTSRINFRGTRTVGNDGNPAEAEPSLNVVEAGDSVHLRNAIDWEVPYRMEIILNQTGSTIVYNTPWEDEISLGDERLHVYLYNLSTGMNVAHELEREDPYVIEAGFLNGRINDQDVAGTLANVFWKHVTGRRKDMSFDNFTIYENVAVVTDPGMSLEAAPMATAVQFARGEPTAFQPDMRNSFSMRFTSETGMTYGLRQSTDLESFTPVKTIIPADSTQPFTEIDIPITTEKRFYQVYPLIRGE